MKIKELFETASAGATSAGDIATVTSPHVAAGKRRLSNKVAGSPGHPGTESPKLPVVKQLKNKNGTAKNALDQTTNLFGGSGAAIKR